MKKLTAVAAALLVATTSANAAEVFKNDSSSLDLYGRAYAGHIFGDDKAESQKYGSNTFFRYGLKGQSSINSDLTALGQFEAQQYIGNTEKSVKDDSSSLRTRLAFGGVQHKTLGALTYGRQNGAGYAITGWTDVALSDPYGNDGLGAGTDVYGVKRSSDVLKYEVLVKGFQFDASYKFRNQTDTYANGAWVSQDNSAYGVAASYTLPINLSFGTTYNVGKQSGNADDAKLWVIGTKFDNKAWYAAFNYADGKNWVANGYDHKGYEAALGYNFASGFGLMALWNQQKSTNASDVEKNTVDYYTLGAQYKFNKNLRVITEYRINQLKADTFSFAKPPVDASTGLAVDAKNDFAVAVRYDF